MYNKKALVRYLGKIEAKPTSHNIGLKQVLFDSKDTDSAITQIALCNMKSGESVEYHVHQTMNEYYLFNKGNCILDVDGEEIDCHENMYVLVPAKAKHALKVISDSEFITIGVALD